MSREEMKSFREAWTDLLLSQFHLIVQTQLFISFLIILIEI
jgi:hypothetical protein